MAVGVNAIFGGKHGGGDVVSAVGGKLLERGRGELHYGVPGC